MIKISLDEESIEVIVKYIKNNRNEIREIIKIIGIEALSILKEKEIVKEGAKLYREMQSEINYTYKK